MERLVSWRCSCEATIRHYKLPNIFTAQFDGWGERIITADEAVAHSTHYFKALNTTVDEPTSPIEQDAVDFAFLTMAGSMLFGALLVAAIKFHGGAVPLTSSVNKLPAHAQSTVTAEQTPYCTQSEGSTTMMPNLTPHTVVSLINSHRGGVALRTDFGQYVNVANGQAAQAIDAAPATAKFCVSGVGTAGVMFVEKMP